MDTPQASRIGGPSLSARIALAAVLLIGIVTVVQIILVSAHGRTQYLNEVQSLLKTRAEYRGSEFQRSIDEFRRDTLFLARTPPVEGILQASTGRSDDPQRPFNLDSWKNRLRELFTASLEGNPEYFRICYIGTADDGLELVRVERVDGRVVPTPQNLLRPTNDRTLLQDARHHRPDEVSLSDIGLRRSAGKLLTPLVREMQAAMSIYAGDGSLFGVIVIDMDVGPALDRLSANLSDGTQTYLMNRDGDYLVRTGASRASGFDLEQRHRWQDEIVNMSSAGQPGRLMTVAAPEGPLYAVERVLHFDPRAPERYMTLIYAQPDVLIAKQLAGTRTAMIAGALGVAVVIGMLFLLYLRRTLLPLSQLTAAAHAIGDDRHDVSLPVNASGEIGVLAHAFENMQAGLQQREKAVRQLMDVQRQSEERFRLMTTSVKDYAIIMFDPLGRVVTWNEGAQRLKGYTETEIIGQPLARFYLPEDIAAGRPDELLRRAAVEGRCEDDRWHVRKDGVRFYADSVLTAMRGDAGDLLGFTEITRDITERKRTEQALREKDKLLATMGAMAKVGGWEFDVRTLKGTWTDEVARIHELDPEDGTDVQSGLKFYVDESREKIEAAVKAAIEQAEPYDLELEMIAAKGTRKWVRTIGQPQLEDGVVIRVMGSFQDITERKRAEDEIRRINVELEERVLQRTADLQRATDSMREALATLDASLDGAFIFDPNTLRFSYVNEGAVRQVGYSREELLLMSPVDISPEYDERDFRELIEPLICGEKSDLQFRTSYRHKDGSGVPIEVVLQYVNANGEQPRFIAIVRDISARQAIEMELERSEQLANNLIDAAPEAITVVDAEGYMMRVNNRMEQIFGYRKEELLGQPVEMLLPESYRGGHVALRHDYIANATVRMMGAGRDVQGRRKDGSEFYIEVSLGAMRIGEQRYVIASLSDISQRKAAEAMTREAAAKLARSNAELEQFAYVASHDLQEPLRMVASYVQLLERRYRDSLDAEAREFIAYASDGARRMQGLITDLLDYSRVQSRGNAFTPTDLNRVFDQTIADLAMQISDSGAELLLEPLPIVVADATQMRQLMQNLVGNALKYHGTGLPRVRVSARRIEAAEPDFPDLAPSKGWLLTVDDNGIGIEPQYYERIFQLFQRLHTRSEYEGSGLGLALCRRIVERHGGRIWVRSEPGVGSTFFAALPD